MCVALFQAIPLNIANVGILKNFNVKMRSQIHFLKEDWLILLDFID